MRGSAVESESLPIACSESARLTPDAALTVNVPNGGYLAPDETDVHPDWSSSFTIAPQEYAKLVPLFFPSSDAARTAFGTRSASHQERTLDAAFGGTALAIAPAAFAAFYAELDSTAARRSAELTGCINLATGNTAWGDVLASILPTPSFTSSSRGYAACGTDFAKRNFGDEFARVAGGIDARQASRFVYLSSYDYGAAATLDALMPIAVQGPSLQLREQALNRLSYQASPRYGYSAVPADQALRWKEFFRARLTESKSATRFQTIWRGVVGLGDDGALLIAAQKLHSLAPSDSVQRQVVCDAYTIAQAARPEAWTDFGAAAQPWDTLSASARAVLMAGGAGCGP